MKKIRIVLLGIFILAVMLLSACGGSGQSANTSSTTPVPNPSPSLTAQNTPTSTPTTKPSVMQTTDSTPTSKPTVVAVAGPTMIGGTLGAFVAKFGHPNNHSDNLLVHFQQYPDSNVDYLILLKASATDQTIETVDANADNGKPWDIPTAKAICQSFMPPDAEFQKRVDIPGSASQLASFDMIYFSATLATKFSADQFTDVNQNTVKPGLFDINYLYNDNKDLSHINSCNLEPGTQQTQ